MVLSGSRRVSVVLCSSQVLVGSQCSRRFSMVLSGSRRFSVLLLGSQGSQCSHRFSVVLSGSRSFSVVLVGSRLFSMFLSCSCWFS